MSVKITTFAYQLKGNELDMNYKRFFRVFISFIIGYLFGRFVLIPIILMIYG